MIKEIMVVGLVGIMILFIVVQLFKLFGGWAIFLIIIMLVIVLIFIRNRQGGGVEEEQ